MEPIDVETYEQPAQAVAVREPSQAIAKATPIETAKPVITAAQAKVEAIANLTMAAYEKAATLHLTPEESQALQADFPDEAFQPGAAGKESLIYIEHAHLRDRFTQVFGLGQWAIIPRNRWAEPFTVPARYDKPAVEGQRIYVEAMLVVRGCFVGEAVGAMEYYPKNNAQNYGDAVEGAKTAAFRRCAKEFGVGLQAWKKEWCEGWWQRKRSGQRAQAPQPQRQAAPPPAQAPKPETQPAPTDESRAKMIAALKAGPGEPNREIVTEYFVKAEILMPSESLEDIPLRWVPATVGQMRALSSCITAFGNGEQAGRPYPPNPEPEAPKAVKKPTEVPREKAPTPAPGSMQEWFFDVIVPIPHKGQKRDEYLQNPDTIGSLFLLRHEETEEGQEARKRLWGFVTNYEPKGWQKRDGTQMPASESDKKFREALDAFMEWFEKNHPNEKL